MSKTFVCAECKATRPVALLFHTRFVDICLWCAEDNGLTVKRFPKGY